MLFQNQSVAESEHRIAYSSPVVERVIEPSWVDSKVTDALDEFNEMLEAGKRTAQERSNVDGVVQEVSSTQKDGVSATAVSEAAFSSLRLEIERRIQNAEIPSYADDSWRVIDELRYELMLKSCSISADDESAVARSGHLVTGEAGSAEGTGATERPESFLSLAI